MKVLVTGAFSTGKTSIVTAVGTATELGGAFARVSVRPDPARSCPLPLNREQSLEASLWLASKVIADESLFAFRERAETSLLVCDRSFPDILSHTPFESVRSDSPEVEALEGLARHWTRGYSLVFLSEIDHAHPVEPDGLRVNDPGYRLELQSKLVEWLHRLEVKYIALPATLGERREVIVKAIAEELASER